MKGVLCGGSSTQLLKKLASFAVCVSCCVVALPTSAVEYQQGHAAMIYLQRHPQIFDSAGFVNIVQRRNGSFIGISHAKTRPDMHHPAKERFILSDGSGNQPRESCPSLSHIVTNKRHNLSLWKIHGQDRMLWGLEEVAFHAPSNQRLTDGQKVSVLNHGKYWPPMVVLPTVSVHETPFAIELEHHGELRMRIANASPAIFGSYAYGQQLVGTVAHYGRENVAFRAPEDSQAAHDGDMPQGPAGLDMSNAHITQQSYRIVVTRPFPALLEHMLQRTGTIEIPEPAFDIRQTDDGGFEIKRTIAQSPEKHAGLNVMQRLVTVDGVNMTSQQQLVDAYLNSAGKVSLGVFDPFEGSRKQIDFKPISADQLERGRLESVGLKVVTEPSGMRIEDVSGYAAKIFQPGDLILGSQTRDVIQLRSAGTQHMGEQPGMFVIHKPVTIAASIRSKGALLTQLERSNPLSNLIVERESSSQDVTEIPGDQLYPFAERLGNSVETIAGE